MPYQCILSRSRIDYLSEGGEDNQTVYVFYLEDPKDLRRKMDAIRQQFPEIEKYGYIEVTLPDPDVGDVQEGFFSLHEDRKNIGTLMTRDQQSFLKKYFGDRYRAVIKEGNINWYKIELNTIFDQYISARYLFISRTGKEFFCEGPLPTSHSARQLSIMYRELSQQLRDEGELLDNDILEQMVFLPPEVEIDDWLDYELLLKPVVNLSVKDQKGHFQSSGMQIEQFLHKHSEQQRLKDLHKQVKYMINTSNGDLLIVKGPELTSKRKEEFMRFLMQQEANVLKDGDFLDALYLAPEVKKPFDQLDQAIKIFETDHEHESIAVQKESKLQQINEYVASQEDVLFEQPRLSIDIDGYRRQYYDSEVKLSTTAKERQYTEDAEELGEEWVVIGPVQKPRVSVDDEGYSTGESDTEEREAEAEADTEEQFFDAWTELPQEEEEFFDALTGDEILPAESRALEGADEDYQAAIDSQPPVVIESPNVIESPTRQHYGEFWLQYTLNCLSLFGQLSSDCQTKHIAGAFIVLEKMTQLIDEQCQKLFKAQNLCTIKELERLFFQCSEFDPSPEAKRATLNFIAGQIGQYVQATKELIETSGLEMVTQHRNTSLESEEQVSRTSQSSLLAGSHEQHSQKKTLTRKISEVFVASDEVVFQDSLRTMLNHSSPKYLDDINSGRHPPQLDKQNRALYKQLSAANRQRHKPIT